MDLYNTSLALAGASDRLPTDRYIDGIDQRGFLFSDDGKSAREKVYMWAAYTPMAIRMYEYKLHVKVLQAQAQWLDIDMATKTDVGLSPWLFNLYIDPKEQYAVGHRMNPWLASIVAELKAHTATFEKYPPKDVGLK
jgi:arylsulfatase